MSYGVEWNGRRWLATLTKDLKKNAEGAGKFIVQEARQNLLAYENPKKGKSYRGLVSTLIDYEVKEIEGTVTLTVEVDKTKSFWAGYYIEIGSKSWPRRNPYLRPAIFGNMPIIIEMLLKGYIE